jgi:hypothetical protein
MIRPLISLGQKVMQNCITFKRLACSVEPEA